MKRCQRLQILQLGPVPGQGPDPDLDLIPGLTLEATLGQDPENVAIGKFSEFSVCRLKGFWLCDDSD